MSNVTAAAHHTFTRLSPDEVYSAWIDRDLVLKRMTEHFALQGISAKMTRVEIDPVVGGRYHFADSRDESDAWGRYEAMERPSRLVFSWFVTAEEEAEDNSTVTLAIQPSASGALATITHEMSDEWAEYVPQTAQAWASMLNAIEVALSPR